MVGTWPGVDVRRLATLIGAAALLACAAPGAEAAPVDPTARLELAQPDGARWSRGATGTSGCTGWRPSTDTRSSATRRAGTGSTRGRSPPGHWRRVACVRRRPSGRAATRRTRRRRRRGRQRRPRGDPDVAPAPERRTRRRRADRGRGPRRGHAPLARHPRPVPGRGRHHDTGELERRFFGAADSVRDYYDEVSYGAWRSRRRRRAAVRRTTASSAG